ncbi:FAD/NAD(P)-binding domain-containing protein [Diaporthe amygdali]|uniref:FAD/NAD(P)-binding domain-containing protein n=1 Tax=Phomopsis amygdali TaxID=1214568 RepID=UPI0022FEE657|nr:FAD/NAD(P)-binding domain-containing protein [Diaporthe amygdali]KAJ0120863.1 FAD/NAD(P)-binding domain-containing protein [Diaporthe amygdali]
MHVLLTNLLLCVAAAHGTDETKTSAFSPESYKPENVIDRDVAIIGGGSAGTYSAVRLVDHNLTAAVMEPKAQLGGHAETYTDPSGWTVDIGVVVFEPFKLHTDYFTRFDVPLIPRSSLPSSSAQFMNFETGEAVEYVTGYDLNYPVDEDLLLPFHEFADKCSLSGALRSIYHFEQGYSEFLKLSTIYVLKQFGQGLFEAVTTSPKPIIARKVLITAPLIKVYDSRDNFDLSKDEDSLFKQFFANGYYTGIIKNTGPPANFTATGADPDQPYGRPTLPGLYRIASVPALPGLFQVYYGIPQPKPSEAVQLDIEAIVGRIQKASGVPPSRPEWAIFSDHSPYNTMVEPEAIRAGFYKDLLALQGKWNTFYTGATWETQD